jgi:hypothetical protein
MHTDEEGSAPQEYAVIPESFNAKIKAFRAQFRGVTNIGFFLFRLTRIYA